MLDRFAKLLGIRPDQAEDALHSERAAKHVVSRRSFFGASAALTAGTVFSFPVEAEEKKIAVPDLQKMAMRGPWGCTGPGGIYFREFTPVASGIDLPLSWGQLPITRGGPGWDGGF